jgi:hypothetical protein
VPQINLLKQTRNTTGFPERFPHYLAMFFVVVLLGILGYYTWLFVRIRFVTNETAAVEATIRSNQAKIVNFERHHELLTRQGQLKELTALIQNHIHWDFFLPELARITLNTASYTQVGVLSDGNVSLNVTVPDYRNVDKYLQVFDSPFFNEHFSNVSIGSLSQTQSDEGLVTTFDAQMKFNTGMLKYNFRKK